MINTSFVSGYSIAFDKWQKYEIFIETSLGRKPTLLKAEMEMAISEREGKRDRESGRGVLSFICLCITTAIL